MKEVEGCINFLVNNRIYTMIMRLIVQVTRRFIFFSSHILFLSCFFATGNNILVAFLIRRNGYVDDRNKKLYFCL